MGYWPKMLKGLAFSNCLESKVPFCPIRFEVGELCCGDENYSACIPDGNFHVTDKVKVMLSYSGRLVVLRLNVPVNNFSVMSGRSHRFLGN